MQNKQLPHEIIIGRLKALGLPKVEVTHFRRNKVNGEYHAMPLFRSMNLRHVINPNGGSTLVSVNLGTEIVSAAADCSHSDHFNRRQGLTIALRRLYKKVILQKKLEKSLPSAVGI